MKNIFFLLPLARQRAEWGAPDKIGTHLVLLLQVVGILGVMEARRPQTDLSSRRMPMKDTSPPGGSKVL